MTKSEKKLLIIEDDPGLQSQLKWSFEGYDVLVADDYDKALAHLRRSEPEVITLDLGLPPDPGGVTVGFKLLKDILSLAPQTKIIVITGHNDTENAVRAIGLGAYDFYEKPVDPNVLNLVVERATRLFALEQENWNLQQRAAESPVDGIITVSPEMRQVCRTVEKLAPTNVSTLLLGDSGTGKELLVRALHKLSNRSAGNFVAINCAAIPETLLESELFGYEKGAFTGATKTTPGKIETADGGFLFLDEIGDLPQSLQAKLLRFLQERVIERVGGRKEIPVDVRVVCATHRDLNSLIDTGNFRQDLYYRINEATIKIPPLKDRQGDAVVLARWLLNRFSSELNRVVKGFDKQAIVGIEQYDWPGNVRELENRIKRAVIMADDALITLHDLELESESIEDIPFNLREIREQAEKQAIKRALGHADNNVSHTAKMLGVTRPTLYNLIKKYSINA
ncbi:MAG: PEP-CTERM-box response regulator transcription factor [Gammaproteobacteria bacterium]|nr:PEP-CTERM-box response regulator transcription factor [Gammaproteobacteria bacterium]